MAAAHTPAGTVARGAAGDGAGVEQVEVRGREPEAHDVEDPPHVADELQAVLGRGEARLGLVRDCQAGTRCWGWCSNVGQWSTPT